MKKKDILEAYKTFLHPILDFACVVYCCFFTRTQSLELDRMQTIVKKIIYGRNHDQCDLEDLELRRQRLFDQFVIK